MIKLNHNVKAFSAMKQEIYQVLSIFFFFSFSYEEHRRKTNKEWNKNECGVV